MANTYRKDRYQGPWNIS